MTEVKSSGADPPAAISVAPATSGEMPNFSVKIRRCQLIIRFFPPLVTNIRVDLSTLSVLA
jgi:hypothetical protein